MDSEKSLSNQKYIGLLLKLSVFVLLLFSFFLVFQIGQFFADILRILGISLLLSYLVINIVDFLERYLRFRAVAIIIVYAVLLCLAVLACVLVIPSMVYQITQVIENLWNSLPEAIQWLTRSLGPLEQRLHAAQIPIRAVDIISVFVTSIPKPEPSIILDRISSMAVSTMTWLVYGISIIVVSFYFLLDGHRLKDYIVGLSPKRHQPFLQTLASQMDRSLQSFFRGQIVLAVAAGAIMLIIYLTLGVHYALLLSVFLAVWEIVPVIGPPIGFLPTAISVGFYGLDNVPCSRFAALILVLIIFNVLQQLKDNVVAPRYMGNVIGIHPILIFVAIMVGARVDGLVGIIFALPAACVINVLLHNLPKRDNGSQAEISVEKTLEGQT